MNWLVTHCSHVERFLQAPEFFAEPLRTTLGIPFPLRTLEECEKAYQRVLPFVRDSKQAVQTREHIAFCFALLLAHFFIHTAGHAFEMRRKDVGGGPFVEPLVAFTQNGSLCKVSVVSSVLRVLHTRIKEPFRNLWWHLTGIPTQDPI